MPSLIDELQQLAVDGGVSATELLQKCLIVSTKLGFNDFADWARQELDGYKDTAVPDYRIIHGDPQVFDPYRGYQPLHCSDPKFKKAISRMHFNQPIGEIEHDLRHSEKSGSDAFQITYAPDFEKKLMDGIEFNLRPSLHVSASQLRKIIDGVRKVVLEWSLKLEADGIVGEGMGFSKDEKKKASTITYNIQNYIRGEFKGSQIQVDTTSSNQNLTTNQFNIEEVKQLVGTLNASLDELELSQNQKEELMSEIKTLDSQAGSPKPKQGIIRESLLSIRTILEAASGNLVASGILNQIGALFGP
ncbi:MAG TPA: hypothetical protein VI935_07560 [Thermodesulfobacteriota bacterium]|nr:hypothetical protein [Thermodesulfobacteriota bacterium]